MVKIKHDKCGLCVGCVSVCPYESIFMINGKIEVFKECTDCGICIQFCPADAIEIEKNFYAEEINEG